MQGQVHFTASDSGAANCWFHLPAMWTFVSCETGEVSLLCLAEQGLRKIGEGTTGRFSHDDNVIFPKLRWRAYKFIFIIHVSHIIDKCHFTYSQFNKNNFRRTK